MAAKQVFFRLHEMQTIVTDVRGVCQSVRQPVSHGGSTSSASLCGGHSVQPLPNYFGLLFKLPNKSLTVLMRKARYLQFDKRRESRKHFAGNLLDTIQRQISATCCTVNTVYITFQPPLTTS